MRYKLMVDDRGGEPLEEVLGQRKKTKKDIEQWINHNIQALGLDWRVGYTVKFLKGKSIYTWVWIKDNSDVTML